MSVQYAVLNSDNLLVAWETFDDPLEPVPGDRVEVPVGCDLALRRYVWLPAGSPDNTVRRFAPVSIRSGRIMDVIAEPEDDSLVNIAKALDALANGRAMPDESKRWADRLTKAAAPVRAVPR